MKNINSVKIPKVRGKRDFKFEDCEAEIKRQIQDKFENPQYFKINSSRDGYAVGYVEVSFLGDRVMNFGLPDNCSSYEGKYSFGLADDSLANFYWEGKAFNDFKTDLNEALDILSNAMKIPLKSSKAREPSPKRNADSVKRLFSSISESEVEKYTLDDFSFGGWSAPDIKSNEELDKAFDAEIDTGNHIAAYLSAKENGVEISPENEGFFQKCLEKLKPENNWYLKIKDEYIQHAYEEAAHGNLGYGKDYWSIKAELKKLKDELNETEKWKENKIIRLEYHIAELEAMLKGYGEYNEEPSKVQGDTYVDKYADLYEKGKSPEHYNRWMAGMKSKGYY